VQEAVLRYQLAVEKGGDISYMPTGPEADTGFHAAFAQHRFSGENEIQFRDRLGMRDNETYSDWAERIVAEGDAAGKKHLAEPRLPQWLESIPEEALGRRSYMATPQDFARITRTPEQIKAEKEARKLRQQPVSSRDFPPEEKPLDLTRDMEVHDLTPDMDLKEDNRPASEKFATDLDYVRDTLRRDGFYRISEAHRQETFRIRDQTVRKLAPPGVKVFVIREIKLAPKPWVIYGTSTGEEFALPESLSRPASTFGFFEPSSNRIYISRVTALGQSDHLLRGIVVHEVSHFARKNGVFSPTGVLKNAWSRILAHANTNDLLDMTVAEYADLIGDPLRGSKTVS
jgi:hypothetical protein